MSAQKLSTYQKVRAGVWATGIGIIVMAGTWYGAGLKEQKQFEEKKKMILEAPVEEKIAVLEAQKKHLNGQKELIQRKLDVFHVRVKERERVKEEERRQKEAAGRQQ